MITLLKTGHWELCLIVLLAITTSACKQTTNTNTEVFVKTWQSVENPLRFKSTLSISEDGSFSYAQEAELGKGFSNGKWIIEGSYLILSSNKPDSCYYVAEYGNEWTAVTDGVLSEGMKTPLNDCQPENYIEFVVFERDSFYIRNDSLFHSSEPNDLFPFYTNVFW